VPECAQGISVSDERVSARFTAFAPWPKLRFGFQEWAARLFLDPTNMRQFCVFADFHYILHVHWRNIIACNDQNRLQRIALLDRNKPHTERRQIVIWRPIEVKLTVRMNRNFDGGNYTRG